VSIRAGVRTFRAFLCSRTFCDCVHTSPPPVESSPKSCVGLFKVYFNVFSIVAVLYFWSNDVDVSECGCILVVVPSCDWEQPNIGTI